MVDPEKTDIARTFIRKAKYAVASPEWNFGRKRFFCLRGENGLWKKWIDFFGNRVFQENAIAVVAKNQGFFYDALTS